LGYVQFVDTVGVGETWITSWSNQNFVILGGSSNLESKTKCVVLFCGCARERKVGEVGWLF